MPTKMHNKNTVSTFDQVEHQLKQELLENLGEYLRIVHVSG